MRRYIQLLVNIHWLVSVVAVWGCITATQLPAVAQSRAVAQAQSAYTAIGPRNAVEATPATLPIRGGEDVGVYTFPRAGVPPAGFRATVTVAPMPRAGYIPVTVRIGATGIFPADRRFLVRISQLPGLFAPPANGIINELPVQVSQGDRVVTANRMIPIESIGNGFRVEILEDGRVLEGYTEAIGTVMALSSDNIKRMIADEKKLQILWVYEDAADGAKHFGSPQSAIGFRDTVFSPSLSMQQRWISDDVDEAALPQTLERLLADNASATAAELAGFPFSDWRCFQRFDTVILTWPAAQIIKANSPEVWDALREWIFCGGAVGVVGTPGENEVTNVLSVSIERTAASDRDWTVDDRFRAKIRNAKPLLERIEYQGPTSGRPRRPSPTVAEAIAPILRREIAHYRRADRDGATVGRFHIYPLGAGVLVTLPTDPQLNTVTSVNWDAAGDVLSATGRESLMHRRGVDPILGDYRFRQWLIAGVAQPPVYTFMGLLTVFVILVGPVAYRQTMRSGRGYLMFAIAPVLAFVTTAAMLGYGIIADGFGTKARVRQLTFVDGASGDAGERVRATYFAGIQPRGGLTFPGNAEVLSYPQHTGKAWEERVGENADYRGTVTVTDSTQRFSRSFLPSREQRQFVVHRPKRRVGRLAWSKSAAPAESAASQTGAEQDEEGESGSAVASGPLPRINSTFDFELRELIVRDSSGNYWSSPRLEANAKRVELLRLTSPEAGKRLGEIHLLEPLIDTGKRVRLPNNSNWRTYDLMDAIHDFGNDTLLKEGVFEGALRSHLFIQGDLSLNTFVAVADVTDDALALDSPEMVDSIRLVYGTMP